MNASNKRSTNEFSELGDSFLRFSRRNSSWWYLFFILCVLFSVAYVYNKVNNRSQTPIEKYHAEFIQLQKRVGDQEERIQQLEEEIHQLREQLP